MEGAFVNRRRLYRFAWLAAVVLVFAGCTSTTISPDRCPPDRQALENCPPLGAVDDPELNRWYDLRSPGIASDPGIDPTAMAIEANIPVQAARAWLLGSSESDALLSLAAKIHMIERAEHSIDAVYYIFSSDLVGRAFLGALCAAVQRGVDVRLLVDSVGSISLDKTWLRTLHSCEADAGFVRNSAGEVTTRRARAQVILFNALTRSPLTANRRSHDKLMVIDGFVRDRAVIITGGRNISLSYYGILADGSPNPDTYNDAEILLRPGPGVEEEHTVGEVAEIYYTLLVLYEHNKHLISNKPLAGPDLYADRRDKMAASLIELKSLPALREPLEAAAELFAADWHEVDVRLAHEMANLTNQAVVTEAVANLSNNPNSIMHLLEQARGRARFHSRVVSPYLFLARYYDDDGNLVLDEAARILEWLAESPDHRYEMITNSVLTSDNIPAQAIVDMDMAPRLLLDDEWLAQWQTSDLELNAELLSSADWEAFVDHPQLSVYETGRLDDAYFGGDRHYGKLHAKYIIGDKSGFLGTANFDYRSRLFNNEMGFFFIGPEMRDALIADFEHLKSQSYRWGSPEWLELRRRIVEKGGLKGQSVKNQRQVFQVLRKSGLEYQF